MMKIILILVSHKEEISINLILYLSVSLNIALIINLFGIMSEVTYII